MPNLRPRCRRAILLATLLPSPLLAATTPSTWLSPTTGTWTSTSLWSTSPNYPQNNTPAGSTYSATLSPTGSPYTLTLSSPISLDSLSLTSPDATLLLTGSASITASSAITLSAGTLNLYAGSLVAPSISSSPTAQFFVGNASISNATVSANLTVGGTLSLNSSARLRSSEISLTDSSTINLAPLTLTGGSSPIDISFNHLSSYPYTGSGSLTTTSTSLTLGPQITARTLSIDAYIGSSSTSLLNQGTLSAEAPAKTLSLRYSSFSNTGTLKASNGGTLSLSANLSTANLGSFSVSSNSVLSLNNLTLDNTSSTLSLTPSTGSLTFNLSILKGGTVTGAGGAGIILPDKSSLVFDSATLAAPLSASNSSVLSTGSLTLAAGGSINFNTHSSTVGASLSATSLLGTGQITATGDAGTTTIGPTGTGAPFTISPNISIQTSPSPSSSSLSISLVDYSFPILNQGSILSTGTNHSISLIAPSITNTGSLSASNSAQLHTNEPLTNTGSITASNGALISLNGTLSNPGSITISTGSTLVLASITDPSPFAHISASNSTVLLSSSYTTSQLNTFSRNHTDLGIASPGTLQNSSSTLSLSDSLGSFALAGGTVTGGTLSSTGSARVYTYSSTFPSTSTLDSVTLDSDFLLSNNSSFSSNLVNVTGSLTITPNHRITLAGGGKLQFVSSATLAGSADIVFDSTPNFTSIGSFAANLTPFTIPAGFTLRTGSASASVYVPTLTLQGVLSAETPGKILYLTSSLTNAGTLQVLNNSTLKLTGSLTSNPGLISILSGTFLLDYTGSSPIDNIRTQLLTNHITSSPNTSLAYTELSLLPANSPRSTTARSQGADNTTILLFPTLTGDANLDGTITPDDYALLDRSYAQSLPNPHWTDGDFNYDGIIDQSDYLLLDLSLYQAQGFSPGFLSQRESQFGAPYIQELMTSIPEPSPFLLLAASPCLLTTLSRRRRQQN